jgi:hypothetical protein
VQYTVPPCTLAGVTQTASSAPAGSIVTFDAIRNLSCDYPLYQYWYRNLSGTWIIGRPWANDPVWNFDTTGLPPGLYDVHVWSQRAGDPPTSWQSNVFLNLTLTGCTSATLTPTSVTQPAGSTVDFTASTTSSGCPAPVYEYWVQMLDGKWYMKRAFDVDGTWAWDTSGLRPGTYTVHAWANQQGAYTGALEAVASSTVNLTGCSAASVLPSSGGVRVGTPVIFTASAVGCPTPTFEWWVQDTKGIWHRMTGFNPYSVNTWTWNPTGWGKGTYHIHAWANQQGAFTGLAEAIGTSTFSLT